MTVCSSGLLSGQAFIRVNTPFAPTVSRGYTMYCVVHTRLTHPAGAGRSD